MEKLLEYWREQGLNIEDVDSLIAKAGEGQTPMQPAIMAILMDERGKLEAKAPFGSARLKLQEQIHLGEMRRCRGGVVSGINKINRISLGKDICFGPIC